MPSPYAFTRTQQIRLLDAPMYNRYVKAVQRGRVRADAQFALHRALAAQMVDRRKFVRRDSPIILEVGSHTGWFLRHMLQRKEYFGCKQYIQCDVSEERLNENYNDIKHLLPEDMELVQICCDEEQPKPFEIPDKSVDMVVSCLSLHWVNKLEQAMVNIRNALKRDGFLMLAMFGGNTLYELRSAFSLADTECKGGMSAHCSPHVDGATISSLVLQSGFNLPSIDMDRFVLTYDSPFDLLEHIQSMGEQACHMANVHVCSNKTTLPAMAAVYDHLFRKNGVIPATFEVFHSICWSPHPLQKDPLPRGSGEVSLASVGSVLHKQFTEALAESARNPNDAALQKKADDLYNQLRDEMEKQAERAAMPMGAEHSPDAAEILKSEIEEGTRSPGYRKPAPPNVSEEERREAEKLHDKKSWKLFEDFVYTQNPEQAPAASAEGADVEPEKKGDKK